MDFTGRCLDTEGWFNYETTVQAKIPIKWTCNLAKTII